MKRSLLLCGLALSLLGSSYPISVAQAEEPARIAFAELYASIGVLGLQFSDKVKGLAGRPVAMRGFMAPPLKPEADFFVLTREPVSLCPFCQTDADWPTDIVVVYPHDGPRFAHDGLPVAVSGVLEIGSKADPQTGFVSLVRIFDANVKELR